MKSFILHQAYNLLILLAYPWIKKRLAKETTTPEAWAQRAGIIADFTNKEVIWVHCASVGEVNAALPIIKQLEVAYPLKLLVVTTMTATGAARVKQSLPKAVHIFLPLDTPSRMHKFLTRLNPQVGIIMETEIWPNLLFTSQQLGIKLIQANARITPKAFASYYKFRSLIGAGLNSLTFLAAKSAEDKQRYLQLGLAKEKALVAGNIKYDLQITEEFLATAKQLEESLINKGINLEETPLWVAASTHAGEEQLVLAAHKAVLAEQPKALLVIAPRHPERFNQVEELIKLEGLTLTRHSNKEELSELPQVYLLDTLGELVYFYKLAKAALVAGSLVPKGGHNLLEPAALGAPVIAGPYTEEFSEIAQDLTKAEALQVVYSANDLAAAVKGFMVNEAKYQAASQAGLQLVEQNKGSLARHLSLVAEILEAKAS